MKQRNVPDFLEGAPRFVATFRSLRKIMTEMESRSGNNPPSRPSTSDSGGSGASKDEDNVRELCGAFIDECLNALGNHCDIFRGILITLC